MPTATDWLLAEDQALKNKLQGITVSDQNMTARQVKVWFRLPQMEERDITYPYITIDLIDISEAPERAHRGLVQPDYPTPPPGFGQSVEFPIPVNIDYQVTTNARDAWHDRQLMAALYSQARLPLRFGRLEVADGTVRRLDFLEFQPLDTLDRNNKRLFRKAWTVRVSSELFIDQLRQVQHVSAVNLSVLYQLEVLLPRGGYGQGYREGY